MNEEQLLELDISASAAKASALREEARLARSRALDALGDARAKNRKTLDAEFEALNKD